MHVAVQPVGAGAVRPADGGRDDAEEAGDRGDVQPEEAATYAGVFGDDYRHVDWAQPAAEIHRQVCAWSFDFEAGSSGPLAEIDGKTVRLVTTSLTDPRDGTLRVDTGDGPLWIIEAEPIVTD